MDIMLAKSVSSAGPSSGHNVTPAMGYGKNAAARNIMRTTAAPVRTHLYMKFTNHTVISYAGLSQSSPMSSSMWVGLLR